MRKNALLKDFCREIRNSLGRFLSIFLIVTIGVAFFSGIRATEPDMRLTGDKYSDTYNLMDIRVISTLGLTEDDVKALEAVEGVSLAEPGYSSDVLCLNHESQQVLHVMSLLPSMNQAEVVKGRLPKEQDECFVDIDWLESSDYEIGDQITFISGTEDPLTDTFATDTFTIVGCGSSPCYISFFRGSTTIGNGSVAGFAYVPEDSFVMDIYTEIYVQAAGAQALTTFTEEYDVCVESVQEQVEGIREERQLVRYNEIVDDAMEEVEEAKQELADSKAEAEDEFRKAQAEINSGWRQLQDGKQQLEDGRKQLEDGKTELKTQQETLNDKKEELEAGEEELENNRLLLEEKRAELEAGKAEVEQGWQGYYYLEGYLSQTIPPLETSAAQAESVLEQLKASETASPEEIAGAEAALNELQAQLLSLKEQQAMLPSMKAQLEEAERQIEAGEAELVLAEKQITDGLQQIEEGKKQLADGQNQIDAAWKDIETNEQDLDSGAAEISQNEGRLHDAQRELNAAKAEAYEKIADAEEEVADAEKEIAKIENAKWYIEDREVLTEYKGYGENADRMRALGEVFPVLFYLVAALISLTTMTRMVEEQRVQIGTLKALGYSRLQIAGKYLGYAFIATIGGSILGVLIGEKALPYVIIVAYGMMYPHVTDYVLPYEINYALGATIIALICTVGAAWLACYKELQSPAAQLMRPPTPKNGKRVLLEYASFIWKRMNFIWKATFRNLFRYKKRFFMTICGIGGCMGLLMVGFGLDDSISNIVENQYGELQLYDASLILDTSASAEEQQDAVRFVKEDHRVKNAQTIYMEQVKVKFGKTQKEVYLTVPEDVEAYKEFHTFRDRISHEKYALGDEGVILTEKMAAMLDVSVGDEVILRDDIQGEVTVKIVNICENYMGHYMFMTPSLYEEILKRSPEYNAVSFMVKEDEADQIEAVGEEVLMLEGALSVSYMRDTLEQVEQMLTSLHSVLGVIILFAGLLAFVVLYNLNNINITERRRELATLKVLGFYDGEVAAYVYRENVVLTLIGCGVGCILGRILHQFVVVTVEVDAVMFGRTIELPSYMLGIIITIGFSLFVNWVMYYKLRKIDMVESLKSVE